MGVTRELSEFVADVRYATLPGEVCERVKALTLDTVGIMLRARHDAESTPAVQLKTARGTFERYVRVPKGEPENFLTPVELRAKFDGLTAPYLSRARRDAIAAAILSLERASDVGSVLRLTRREAASDQRVAAASA